MSEERITYKSVNLTNDSVLLIAITDDKQEIIKKIRKEISTGDFGIFKFFLYEWYRRSVK